jgi:hypothetical protein
VTRRRRRRSAPGDTTRQDVGPSDQVRHGFVPLLSSVGWLRNDCPAATISAAHRPWGALFATCFGGPGGRHNLFVSLPALRDGLRRRQPWRRGAIPLARLYAELRIADTTSLRRGFGRERAEVARRFGPDPACVVEPSRANRRRSMHSRLVRPNRDRAPRLGRFLAAEHGRLVGSGRRAR